VSVVRVTEQPGSATSGLGNDTDMMRTSSASDAWTCAWRCHRGVRL